MTRKSTFLPTIAALMFPLAANATLIEVGGTSSLDYWSDFSMIFDTDLSDPTVFGVELVVFSGAEYYGTRGDLLLTFSDIYLYTEMFEIGVDNSITPSNNQWVLIREGSPGSPVSVGAWSYSWSEAGPPNRVPEPGTLVLLGIGLAALGLVRRNRV